MATHFKGPVVSENGFEGPMTVDSIQLGEDTVKLTSILKGTIAVNPGEIPDAETKETSVTISGAAVGDIIIMNPPASLEATLSYSHARVSATNTVQVGISNLTANPVTGASLTWSYLILRVEAV